MSRIFISGSSTGLGLMAGELLASQGHTVVLHARNANRAEETRKALPKAENVVVGDLDTIAGAKDVAVQVNALGRFDALIHNAAVALYPPCSAAGARPTVPTLILVGEFDDWAGKRLRSDNCALGKRGTIRSASHLPRRLPFV